MIDSPKVVLVAETVPLAGFDAPLQVTGAQVGAVPDQLVSAWQSRVAEPTRL